MSSTALLQGLPSNFDSERGPAALVPAARRQWLGVDGFITDRLLVSYRAPAERLRSLVPAAFELDERDGFGFLSVCALEVRQMGIRGLPRALRFDNRELLYRLSIRYRGEPTFLTLRSDTSSLALAALGSRFSHYALRRADVTIERAERRLELRCRSRDGLADGHVTADPTPLARQRSSVFDDAARAASWLIGMSFSVAARGTRVLVQCIAHEPWTPRFVTADARFGYVDLLSKRLATRLEYDHTLHVSGIHQRWEAAQWQK